MKIAKKWSDWVENWAEKTARKDEIERKRGSRDEIQKDGTEGQETCVNKMVMGRLRFNQGDLGGNEAEALELGGAVLGLQRDVARIGLDTINVTGSRTGS